MDSQWGLSTELIETTQDLKQHGFAAGDIIKHKYL